MPFPAIRAAVCMRAVSQAARFPVCARSGLVRDLPPAGAMPYPEEAEYGPNHEDKYPMIRLIVLRLGKKYKIVAYVPEDAPDGFAKLWETQVLENRGLLSSPVHTQGFGTVQVRRRAEGMRQALPLPRLRLLLRLSA